MNDKRQNQNKLECFVYVGEQNQSETIMNGGFGQSEIEIQS